MIKSRYKNYWYGVVRKMLQNYPSIKKDKNIQSCIFSMAIEKAIEETKKLPDGELRYRAVDMIYISSTHSIDGAALEVQASRRTVQRWCSKFVYMVGVNAGFTE